MSKKYIWLVTIVLAISLCGMIFIQIKYYQSTAKIKEDQFILTVSKALDQVVAKMEYDDETNSILEGDNPQLNKNANITKTINGYRYSIELPQKPGQNASSKASNYQDKGGYKKANQLDARGLNDLIKSKSRFSNSRMGYQFEISRLARQTMPLKKRVDLNIIQKLIKEKLLNNGIKVLVATVALGMGFDKPDLGFVIHFQRPARSSKLESSSKRETPNDSQASRRRLRAVCCRSAECLYRSDGTGWQGGQVQHGGRRRQVGP